MQTYIIIKVPFVVSSLGEVEMHLNVCDTKGFDLVGVLPTKFEEVWLIFKKQTPWWKRLFNNNSSGKHLVSKK